MKIEFTIHCIPPKHTAQGSNRILKRKNGSRFIGKKSDSNAIKTKNLLISVFEKKAPLKPFLRAIKLDVLWVYPYRKSESKKVIKSCQLKPCDKQPDVDNLMKILLDVMTKCGFWKNDGQIAEIRFRKFWSYEPMIKILIEEI